MDGEQMMAKLWSEIAPRSDKSKQAIEEFHSTQEEGSQGTRKRNR